MSALVAVAAWLLTVVAALAGHWTEALIALVVAVLATVSHLTRPRHGLARHDHVVTDGWHRLDREFRRQRRHGRTLTLARLSLVGVADLDDLAHRLGAELRGDDFVFVADDLLYIVLPEEDTDTAVVPVDRLSGVLHDRDISGTAAVVAYPGDGLTVAGLLDRLESTHTRPVGALPVAAPADPEPVPEAPAAVELPRQSATAVELPSLAPAQPDPGTGP